MQDGAASDDIDVEGKDAKGIGCRDAARDRVSEVWTRWTRGLPVKMTITGHPSVRILCPAVHF